ncbi:MAG: outer membrane protein assembly factor BamA [Rhodobacterales bacterium]|nr:MAG: outer membrane protein assembly factor BamA [Rhodobacterales bacterium]
MKAFVDLSDSGLFQNVVLNPVGTRLIISVIENPIISNVDFEGNKIFKDQFLFSIISSQTRTPFSKGIIDEDIRKILQIYREKGRFKATIVPQKVLLKEGGIGLIFSINEGPRTEIKSINFIGNKEFNDSRLRSVIESSQKSLFSFISTSDDYSELRQEKDRKLLEEFYSDKGFANAKVKSSVGTLSDDGKSFNITYTIFEGNRTSISEVKFENKISTLDLSDIRYLVKTKKGDLYVGSEIEKIRKSLEKKVIDLGFPFAKVSLKKININEKQSVDIVFMIFNGPSLYVERIDIKGNNQTLDKVIRREFSISEGDAFNPALIRKSEEKSTSIRFFKNLSVSVLPGSSSDKAVVTVDVEEAPTGSLNFGAGYSTDTELSGTISLSERNFLGKGQRLLFEVLTSESNKSIKFGFTEPALLNRDLSASIDLTYLDLEPRQSSFTSNESSIRTGFGFKLGNDTRLITSLKILEEKISVPISSNSLILKEDQGKISKSELSFDYLIDGRDSIIKPKNGFLLRSDITISGLGSRNSYIKGSARGKIYNSFFDDLITVTGELEGGFMQMQNGFSRTVDRFSLGGRSLRGFQYGQIGPREGDEPLGGENYAVSRIEANFPIGLPKELGFYGGIFAEAGSLWGLNYDKEKIEIDANDLKSVDSQIRSSVGFTLYWSTPIGPLQFNWAKPQQYLSGVDKTENFSFNIASQF